MKTERWDWALASAFILFMMFGLSQHAFMIDTAVSPEKIRQIYMLNIAGRLLGALILPFLLPLKDLRQHRRPYRYGSRLVITGLFFLPNIIFRFLGEEVWLANPLNSGIMTVGNGVVVTLMHGCLFTLAVNKRVLWPALAFSAGSLIFNLILGPGRQVLRPFLFTGTGFILNAAGVLLFMYLFNACPPASGNSAVTGRVAAGHYKSPKTDAKQHNVPLFIFPFFAALVIFLANSFTNQLFLMARNSPLPPGFNPPALVLILALPLLGIMAARSWQRFLMIFIPLSSVILLIAPSLLLFSHSYEQGLKPAFLILYTLNTITVRMITAVFPFVIVDMYWRYIEQKKEAAVYGFLSWLLPVSVDIIHTSAVIPSELFNFILPDKAYAVILLTVAAIIFFLLSYKSIFPNKIAFAQPAAGSRHSGNTRVPVLGIADIFKEHKLSKREKEVALLVVQEGLSDKDIGNRLSISPLTVRDHITQIYQKFGVKSRAEFLSTMLRKKQ